MKTAGIYYGNILFLFLYLKKTWNIIYEVDLDIFKWIVTIDILLFSPFFDPQIMVTVGGHFSK